MPLWLTFLASFVFLCASSAGTVWYFVITELAPRLSASEYITAEYEAGTIVVILLVAIGVVFFMLARETVTPVRRLTKAVDGFAEKGSQVPFVLPSFMPKEIRELAHSFIALMGSVEASHARDTEVSRVKSDFISTAAHQLRTPLTSVRWALEALEQGELTPDQKELVKNAADKSKELIGIVGTLLDISAIESGKYKYQFAQMDVLELLAEVARDFMQLAKDRNIVLTYAPGEPLPAIRADRERIKWILTNLVENAIRYTPSGGTVELASGRAHERILVTVRDTGIGIDTKDRGNIFERFYRAQNAVSKESQGNGLGLYIARTIATDHGGDLDFAANDHGPGTIFTLSLPVAGPAVTA